MTPFSDIYSFFLAQIKTCEYIKFSEEERDIVLKQTLRMALAKCHKCKPLRNLKINYDYDEIEDKLDDAAIMIISLWMLVVWLSPKISNISLLEQHLSSKDYQSYSQANHLKELIDLMKEKQKEATYEMQKYAFDKKLEDGGK